MLTVYKMNSASDFFLHSFSVSLGLVFYSVFVFIIYKYAFQEEEKKEETEETSESTEKDTIDNFDVLEEV